MARCNNWPRRLSEYIESRRTTPFEWGSNDCCMFVADWVKILTGIDPASGCRGTYSTTEEALQVMAPYGNDVRGIAGAIFAAHGWSEIPITLAQRGDVVCLPSIIGPTLGICRGIDSVAPGPDGIAVFETSTALAAWGIR